MISLQQAYELFIFDRETFCSPATIRNYKVDLTFLIEHLEQQFQKKADKINISFITPDHLRAYMVYLRNKTAWNKGQKKISSRTIKTYSVDMRTFFHFLYDNEYLQKDIMRNIKLLKEEEKVKTPLFTTEVKEIDALFNTNSKTGLRNSCIFHCMLDAGMRSGEVIRLKIQDVDFKHNIINVVKSKGLKGRLILLAPNLKKMLHKYLLLYRPDCGYDEFFLCSGEYPCPLTDNSVHNLFYRLKKRSGITRLHPHLLRHTFATAFLLQGGDLETLRIYLGHTSYDTTRNYLHLATVYKTMSINDIYKLHNCFFKKM